MKKINIEINNRGGYIKINNNKIVNQVILDGYESKAAQQLKGEIVLDLDNNNKIVGIEIIGDLLSE